MERVADGKVTGGSAREAANGAPDARRLGIVLVVDGAEEADVETCLNSLAFQTSSAFSLYIAIGPDERIRRKIDGFLDAFPHLDVAMFVQRPAPSSPEVARELLGNVAEDYVLFANASSRLHECLVATFGEELGRARKRVDVAFLISAIILDDPAKPRKFTLDENQRKRLGIIVATKPGGAYWGKVWRRSFVQPWLEEHPLQWGLNTLAPALASHAQGFLFFGQKEEPLFYQGFHCAYEDVHGDARVLEALWREDLLIPSLGNEKHEARLWSCVLRRAADYYANDMDDVGAARHVQQVCARFREGGGKRKFPPLARAYKNVVKEALAIPESLVPLSAYRLAGLEGADASPHVGGGGGTAAFELEADARDGSQVLALLAALEERGGIVVGEGVQIRSSLERVNCGSAWFVHDYDGTVCDMIWGVCAHHPLLAELADMVRREQTGGQVGESPESPETGLAEKVTSLLVGLYGMRLADEKQILPGDVVVYPSRTLLYPYRDGAVASRAGFHVGDSVAIPADLYRDLARCRVASEASSSRARERSIDARKRESQVEARISQQREEILRLRRQLKKKDREVARLAQLQEHPLRYLKHYLKKRLGR